jgi:hypothetical protein
LGVDLNIKTSRSAAMSSVKLKKIAVELDDVTALELNRSWEYYQRTGLHVTGDEVDAWLIELEAGHFDAEPPKCHT